MLVKFYNKRKMIRKILTTNINYAIQLMYDENWTRYKIIK